MKNKSGWFYVPAIVALVLDQITKLIARKVLADGSITIIPGFFKLELNYNPGAAFGIMPNWAPLFIIAALVCIFAIVRLRRSGEQSKVLSAGLGLLLGGAVGNMIDRLPAHSQGVTDFLKFSAAGRSWPTFNVADIAIVIGAILILFNVYIVEKRSGGVISDEA